jgi:hypothetical protein
MGPGFECAGKQEAGADGAQPTRHDTPGMAWWQPRGGRMRERIAGHQRRGTRLECDAHLRHLGAGCCRGRGGGRVLSAQCTGVVRWAGAPPGCWRRHSRGQGSREATPAAGSRRVQSALHSTAGTRANPLHAGGVLAATPQHHSCLRLTCESQVGRALGHRGASRPAAHDIVCVLIGQQGWLDPGPVHAVVGHHMAPVGRAPARRHKVWGGVACRPGPAGGSGAVGCCGWWCSCAACGRWRLHRLVLAAIG